MKRVVQSTKNTAIFENSLLENVYAIIDSRIQYLEYQNNCLFSFYTEEGNHKEDKHIQPQAGNNLLINNFDSFLDQVTDSNHSLKLLLFLRTRLTKENARLILDLLTDNRYLNYSQDSLQHYLNLNGVM